MTVTSVMITASTLICLEIVLSINLPPRRNERRLVASDATFFKIRGAISINFAKGLNREKGLIKSELKNWILVRKFYRRAQPQFAFMPGVSAKSSVAKQFQAGLATIPEESDRYQRAIRERF